MGMDERGTRLEYVMFLLVQTQAELFSDLVVVVGGGSGEDGRPIKNTTQHSEIFWDYRGCSFGPATDQVMGVN